MDMIQSWILNRDNNYAHDCEELSQLELMGKVGAKTNELVSEHNKLNSKVDINEKDIEDKISQTNTNKMDKLFYEKDILEVRKIDQTGDFKGSWQGVERPEMSEPGIQGAVIRNTDNIEVINSKITVPYATLIKLLKKENVKIVCYGDSMTYGTILGGQAVNNYPKVLEKKLKYIYGYNNIEVINSGIGGQTSDNGIKELQTRVLNHSPNLLIMSWGLNDCYEDKVPLDKFIKNNRDIILKCRENNIEVVLFTPVPITNKGLGSLYEISVKNYCNAIKILGKEMNIEVIDLYSEMQQLFNQNLITYKDYEGSGHLADYTIVADILLSNFLTSIYKSKYNINECIPFTMNTVLNTCVSSGIDTENTFMNKFYNLQKTSPDETIRILYFHNERNKKLNLNVWESPNGGEIWLKDNGANYYPINSEGVSFNSNKIVNIPLLHVGLYCFELKGENIVKGIVSVSGMTITDK